ncbi:MAG: hypothetical protein ABIA75_01475 [Candidatus Neomarinimicrobiota bacterium]
MSYIPATIKQAKMLDYLADKVTTKAVIRSQVRSFLNDYLIRDTMYLAMPKWKASKLIDAVLAGDVGKVFELTTIPIGGATQ